MADGGLQCQRGGVGNGGNSGGDGITAVPTADTVHCISIA